MPLMALMLFILYGAYERGESKYRSDWYDGYAQGQEDERHFHERGERLERHAPEI